MPSGDGSDDRTHPAWRDAIVAERMAADRAFADQVAESALSNESWELVMSAVELEIHHPEEPSQAALVANTDRLPSVLPAIASIERRGAPGTPGLSERLRDHIPGLTGPSDDRRRTAEALAGAYANAVRAELDANGRWVEICAMAAGVGGNDGKSGC